MGVRRLPGGHWVVWRDFFVWPDHCLEQHRSICAIGGHGRSGHVLCAGIREYQYERGVDAHYRPDSASGQLWRFQFAGQLSGRGTVEQYWKVQAVFSGHEVVVRE